MRPAVLYISILVQYKYCITKNKDYHEKWIYQQTYLTRRIGKMGQYTLRKDC
jgi:hypothetical protein